MNLPYLRKLKTMDMKDIESYSAKRIEDEFNRVSVASVVVNKELDELKETAGNQRVIYIPMEMGEDTISTTNATEGTTIGGTGTFFNSYPGVNVSALIGSGTIDVLTLLSVVSFRNTNAGTTSFFKVMIQFEGMVTPEETTVRSVLGTTPNVFTEELDLLPFVDKFMDGKLYSGVSAWKGAGGGTTQVGDSNGANSMLNLTYGLLIGVR